MANEGVSRKYSSIFLVIVMIILALSMFALYKAFDLYLQGMVDEGNYFLLICIIGFGISSYVMMQSRRRTPRFTIKIPKVSTVITCENCGFKNIRVFKRGDYIFKENGDCPKCNQKMVITAIYREADETEK